MRFGNFQSYSIHSTTLAKKILIDKKYIEADKKISQKDYIIAAVQYIEDCEAGASNKLSALVRLNIGVIQCRCREKGFDPGPIDGYLGPNTDYAISELLGQTDYFKDMPPVVSNWPLEKDVNSFYGEKGKHQVKVKVPYPLFLAWNNAVDIDEITLHEKVADSAARIFKKIVDAYGFQKIKLFGLNQFGGSLNVRLKRGSSTQWSMHSWGCAIDWFPQNNQLHWGMDKASLAKPEIKEFWDIWESEGWMSLGRARNYDWMHVQAAKLS